MGPPVREGEQATGLGVRTRGSRRGRRGDGCLRGREGGPSGRHRLRQQGGSEGVGGRPRQARGGGRRARLSVWTQGIARASEAPRR
eukprot:scaffold7383_cov35-Tisochrysis_lutea.AAC.1